MFSLKFFVCFVNRPRLKFSEKKEPMPSSISPEGYSVKKLITFSHSGGDSCAETGAAVIKNRIDVGGIFAEKFA